MPFFQIVYWVRGELQVVSDRTCSILEYLGHQSNQSNCFFLRRFFSLETLSHSLLPIQGMRSWESSHLVALLCYGVDSGSFPSHWVSNLDRYVWPSLSLWSNSFIGIPSTNISWKPVFTVHALFGQSSLCRFYKQNFLDILEISKLIAKLGLEITILSPVWNPVILLYMWLGLL